MTDLTPLVGEPLALDLVNTVVRHGGNTVDLLATPAQLQAWLGAQADRVPDLPEAPATITPDDVAMVQAVRGHIAVAVDHARRGLAPPADAVAYLNGSQRRAPAIRELRWLSGAPRARVRREGSLGAQLAAHLAEAAVDLLTDPVLATVRQCEAENCVVLFLPAHPGRRWCSRTRCGNRARVARYYRRHKAGRPEPAGVDDPPR
ncbi:CGNR zinc finger domain-containing protein [Micromonospora sp. NPDC050495]|uniref:CGNR zinc finger domain-containing protein n=1 Tax=Micromonospora sp. NPDC050495 TaxID=3154936 RepID=UPI0033E575A1